MNTPPVDENGIATAAPSGDVALKLTREEVETNADVIEAMLEGGLPSSVRQVLESILTKMAEAEAHQ